MKRVKYLLGISIMAMFLVTFTACDKSEDSPSVPSQDFDTDQGANDQTASDELEEAWNNAFDALDEDTTEIQTGRKSEVSGIVLPCGAIKVEKNKTGIGYTFTYGTNCGGKVLSGTVIVTLSKGNKWEDSGAVIKLFFKDYEVLFNANNEVLTFNGSLFITNVDGGLLWQTTDLFGNTPKVVTHLVDGTIDITFDKGDTRTWIITKKRVYQSSNGKLDGVTATLSANGSGGIAEAGTAKDGTPYKMTIPKALIWEVCGSPATFDDPFDLIVTTGEILKSVGPNSVYAEFGYKYDPSSKTGVLVNDCTSDAAKLTFNFSSVVITGFQVY